MLFNQRSFAALALAVFLAAPAQAQVPAPAQNTITLEQAHAKVLAQNPKIQRYRAAIATAAGAQQQAGVRLNPELLFDVENFAGGRPRDGWEAAEFTLGIQQQVEWGGKRQKRRQIAAMDTQWAVQDAQAGMQEILAQTTAVYMRAVIAAERLTLAEHRLQVARKTQKTVKRRVDAAKSADIQGTKAALEVTAAEVVKRQAQQVHDMAVMSLANLMGQSEINADLIADTQALPELPMRDAVLAALEKTPAIQMGGVSIMRARAALDLARAERVPDPTFGVAVRRFNEDSSTALVAGVSVPIMLFNRNQGRIAETGAGIRAAEADTRMQRLQLQQQADSLLQTAARARRAALSYRDDLLPSARKALAQAEKGFDRGAFAFLDLLDAQRTLFDVQEDYLSALNDFYDAYAALDGLSGKYTPLVQAALENTEEGKE